jgi:hypothetical protein
MQLQCMTSSKLCTLGLLGFAIRQPSPSQATQNATLKLNQYWLRYLKKHFS